MSFLHARVDHFVDEMAQRKLPSPAAGSSLALSLAMACALIEMTLSDLEEQGFSSPALNPTKDLMLVRAWREEGKKLIDKDIEAVERMIRSEGDVHSAALLEPVWRIYQLAAKLGELLTRYLVVPNEKISDTLVALLHVRTVFLGTAHILSFNTQQMNMESPLAKEWDAPLAGWDQSVRHSFQQINS